MKKTLFAAFALVLSASAFANIDHSQLINKPGGGTAGIAGADLSQLETGETTLGSGFQGGANTIADDFTLDSKFHVTGISVFGYVTGATAPSVTGVNWAIGDAPTNTLTASAVTSQWWNPNGKGVYRVASTTTSDSTRRIQVGEVTGLNLVLNPGTYFLSIQAPGLNFSPPLPGSLSVYGKNAQQSVGGAAFASLGTDFAYIIHGEAVPEPMSMSVLGLGALALVRKRFKK